MILTQRVAALAAVLVAAAAPADAQAEPSSIAATREMLAKWVETQQIISREKRDWQTGKEVLGQRIAMLRAEIAATEERIAASRSAAGAADQSRRAVLGRNEDLKAATAALTTSIASAEHQTRRLLRMLPEPLATRLVPVSGRIAAEGASPRGSLSERWQNVIGILNEVNKFSRDITVANEIRDLPSGVKAEVQTIYLGLAQGYYVTAKGDAAGVGRPGGGGWTWTAADDLAPRIAEVLAILRNERVPAYVPLPVEIR